nr:MAG TPA: hypothetical protein [Bacteriophage sp.]
MSYVLCTALIVNIFKPGRKCPIAKSPSVVFTLFAFK